MAKVRKNFQMEIVMMASIFKANHTGKGSIFGQMEILTREDLSKVHAVVTEY
jgi:hypothetical protein